MKFLLVAVNAKYIHSNLGVYSLKMYANEHLRAKVFSAAGKCGDRDKRSLEESCESLPEIEIGEYTINNQMEDILKDIYRRKPDAVGFSCYIWNIGYVMELIRDLPKVLPGVEIWLGGPEVSYDAVKILENEPSLLGIMVGEGEISFTEILKWYASRSGTDLDGLETIEGITFRGLSGEIHRGNPRPPVDLSEIPFPYQNLEDFEHRIIYYESSRGCPFSCSYCLSSLDKSVRFREIHMVLRELYFFLEHRVPQVKFVDRTFNCKKSHAMAIWRFLLEHDNGVTNFHFEISADLLDEEELELMSHMRPGLIQLEIGVQTTNLRTIEAIRRKTDLRRLCEVTRRINGFRNIHQHLDLIAGLPYEDYESFKNSFNDVYALRPEQLQLGFLKVLKGSYMGEMSDEYGLLYTNAPPYEVLFTKWLSYGDIARLKAVEEMVEVYYNSGQFRYTMAALENEFPNPFRLFEALAEFYEERGLLEISHNRLARYEILDSFILSCVPEGAGEEKQRRYRDLFLYDLYLRENLKSRPAFAVDQTPYKDRIRDFFETEAWSHRYLTSPEYRGYNSRQLLKMAHLEVFSDGAAVLFDYKVRDPLTHNAVAQKVPFF